MFYRIDPWKNLDVNSSDDFEEFVIGVIFQDDKNFCARDDAINSNLIGYLQVILKLQKSKKWNFTILKLLILF